MASYPEHFPERNFILSSRPAIYDGMVRTHLASLVEDFRCHADETAVVAHRGNRRYRTTYGELAQLAGRFAAELDRRGITPGERVMFWGSNCAEWMGAFFGCLLRGVIAVPLDSAGTPEFANRILKDVSPRLIVGDHSLLSTLTDGEANPRILLTDLASQLPENPNFEVSDSVGPQTPFQIIFTSGTTSEPKGIVHTHRNVLASVDPIEHEMDKYRKYERWVHPLRFLHTLPLSHVFGQFMGLWLPPLLAAEVHFAEQLEARRMTELLRRERISVLVAVPRVLQLLRTHLLGRFENLGRRLEETKSHSRFTKWWRFRKVHRAMGWKFWCVISGGAALPTDLEEFWSGIGIPVIQGYGMTETTALVTLNYPFKIAQGTIGKALPGREVRLSEEGEILVRGDILATATWAEGKMHARKGDWLATGDLGERNERGELRFLGRKDDMIVTGGGMNVHPADLEAAMKKQAGVRDCAVVPGTTLSGIEPVAVVLLSGNDIPLNTIVLAANQELATYQQIRRALVWPDPQFPFTSTGKLLRRKVTEWANLAIENRPTTSNASLPIRQHQDILIDLIAEVTGESPSSADDSLRLTEDLHLDSLGRVQLQTSLEQHLATEFSDDALANLETLGDLRALIAAGSNTRGQSSSAHTAQSQPSPVVTGSNIPTVSADSTPRSTISAEDQLRALTGDEMYPTWPWSWPIAAMRSAFLETFTRPLVWFLGNPRVVNQAGAIPDGPFLVIANHVTAYDGALILYALPGKIRRRIAIAMLGEMLLEYRRGRNQRNALLNFLAPPQYWMVTAFFNVFPMPRQNGFRRSFTHAGDAMDRGYSVMVFPEGARHYDGKLRPFRQGIGLLAQESGVPVLPVALIGLDDVVRLEESKKSAWFRSGLLEVRIGEVIPADPDADPAELTARLEAAVRKLMA